MESRIRKSQILNCNICGWSAYLTNFSNPQICEFATLLCGPTTRAGICKDKFTSYMEDLWFPAWPEVWLGWLLALQDACSPIRAHLVLHNHRLPIRSEIIETVWAPCKQLIGASPLHSVLSLSVKYRSYTSLPVVSSYAGEGCVKMPGIVCPSSSQQVRPIFRLSRSEMVGHFASLVKV